MFGSQPEPVVEPEPPVPVAPVPPVPGVPVDPPETPDVSEDRPVLPNPPDEAPEDPPAPEVNPADVPACWPLLVEPPMSLVDPPDWPALACPVLMEPEPAELAPRPEPFPALRLPDVSDDKLPAGPPKPSDRPQPASTRKTAATAIACRFTG
jgi:hypothetical protein